MNAWLKGLLVAWIFLWAGSALSTGNSTYYICGDGQHTESSTYCEMHGGYYCEDRSLTRQLMGCDSRGGPLEFHSYPQLICTNSRGENSVARSHEECWGNGYLFKCKDRTRVPKAVDCMEHGGPTITTMSSSSGNEVCGDGILDPGEQCDNGQKNSDITPDACRSSCRAAYCGDSVTDTGEQCDDGRMAGDGPNQCRSNCTLPYCGDAILDDQYNEQCDDGNKDETDGCRNDCKTCLRVDENQEDILADALLCKDTYSVVDYGDEGALIIKRPNVVLDCNGAVVQGDGRGMGIVVLRADGATIRNCTVSGFETGIKVVGSRGVVIRDGQNPVYGNQHGLVKENSEVTTENLTKPQIKAPAFSGTPAASKAVGSALKQTAPKTAATGKDSGAKKAAVGVVGQTAPVSGWVPEIRFPRAGQHFNEPLTLIVRLKVKPKEPVIYTLRSLPKRKVKAKSRRAKFKDIPAGKYCVEAALASHSANRSACVPFTVTAPAGKSVEQPETKVQPGQIPSKIQPIPRLPVPKSGGVN